MDSKEQHPDLGAPYPSVAGWGSYPTLGEIKRLEAVVIKAQVFYYYIIIKCSPISDSGLLFREVLQALPYRSPGVVISKFTSF